MGEGAGVLVLEDGEAARARGARVLAMLRGYGATADAHHVTAPHPAGERRRRRDHAGARATPASTPADVVYVNAHGTSTPLNDRAETIALKAALGEHARDDPGLLDEVGDRPPARRRRRGRGGRDDPRPARAR